MQKKYDVYNTFKNTFSEITFVANICMYWINGERGGIGDRWKLNRFQVHRKDVRTSTFVVAAGKACELQSQHPAFSLGKAEDYGNGYDEISESCTGQQQHVSRAQHTHRAAPTSYSRYTPLHALGQGRKSPAATRINIVLAGQFGKRADKHQTVMSWLVRNDVFLQGH